jgi:hypothetical protein
MQCIIETITHSLHFIERNCKLAYNVTQLNYSGKINEDFRSTNRN